MQVFLLFVGVVGLGVGAELLDVAHSYRAEFIVMGAYGHTRLREFIFGGVTRGILQKSDIPLFICN